MSALPSVPPHIIRVTAPLLIGGLFNWCFFGALLVQVYVYSYNFPNDQRHTKLLVYGICFLETVQTVLSGADLFYCFASCYGDLDCLLDPFASPYDGPIFESLVSAIVQIFYAYRIWVITNKQSWWLCFLICLFSTINLAAGITGGVYVQMHQRFATGQHLKSIVITWMGGNVMAGVLVTSATVYHITKLRRKSSRSLRDHTLVKIVRLTIETNVLTTTVALVSLLVAVIYSNDNWYKCPGAILGKLYSNTLLVSLNNRISIREEGNLQAPTQTQSINFVVTSRCAPNPTDMILKELEPPKAVYKLPACLEI